MYVVRTLERTTPSLMIPTPSLFALPSKPMAIVMFQKVQQKIAISFFNVAKWPPSSFSFLSRVQGPLVQCPIKLMILGEGRLRYIARASMPYSRPDIKPEKPSLSNLSPVQLSLLVIANQCYGELIIVRDS